MFKSDGSLFIGMFSRGRPTGKGYYFLKDGTYFEGDVKNNMINDKKGVICAKGIKFTGEISNNILNGEGEEEGERYRFVGIYKDNRRFKGTLEWMHRRHKIKYKGYFD